MRKEKRKKKLIGGKENIAPRLLEERDHKRKEGKVSRGEASEKEKLGGEERRKIEAGGGN